MNERIDDAALERAIRYYEESADESDADVYHALVELRERRNPKPTIVDLRGREYTPEELLGMIVGQMARDSREVGARDLMWVRVSARLGIGAMLAANLCIHYGYNQDTGERLDGEP